MSRSPAGAGGVVIASSLRTRRGASAIDVYLASSAAIEWSAVDWLPIPGLGVEAPKATRPEGLGPERLCNAAERLTGAEAVARLALQALCCKLLGELLDHATNLLGHGTLDRNLLRKLSECLNDLLRQVRGRRGPQIRLRYPTGFCSRRGSAGKGSIGPPKGPC